MTAIAAAAVLLLCGWLVVATHPYGFNYYNPMLGGAPSAQTVMMIGLGEGMDQIANKLNADPAHVGGKVLTSAWRPPLTYFVDNMTVSTVDLRGSRALLAWANADFYVRYITADQRGVVPDAMLDYFDALPPIATVRLSGLWYGAVYDLRRAPLPEPLLGDARRVPLGGDAVLLDSFLPVGPVGPGDEIRVDLVFTGSFTPGSGQIVATELVSQDGDVVVATEKRVQSPTEHRPLWSEATLLPLPSETAPGRYRVVAHIGDRDSGVTVKLGTVEIGPGEDNQSDPKVRPRTVPDADDAEM